MSEIDKEARVSSQKCIGEKHRVPRRARTALLALIAGFVLTGLAAAPASASLGIQSFTASATNQDGTPATQAGSHPYQDVTSINFATGNKGLPIENVKDVKVNLPAGLIGDPNATPKCTVQQLDSSTCPGASQIGLLGLSVNTGSIVTLPEPLYNMVPPPGMAAQFGANVLVVNSFLDVSVRTGSDYGITTVSNNISANLPITGISVTLWGVPADPSHDADRTCPNGVTPCSSGAPQTPFLTMPTQCSGPLTTTLQADSWQAPGDFTSASSQSEDASGNPVGVTGCAQLSFNPTLSVTTDTTAADSPTGVDVDVHVPPAPDTAAALATPNLENAVVTLPPGIALSPAAADGLQACSQDQFGLNTAAEPTCPDASKIGTGEIDSSISADPLTGSIYLAQQGNNPFGSTFAIYVATEADGVLIKLAARIDANPFTGQLTTTFDNNPQLPFTDFKLDFGGGPRAALMTGESCGTFPVTSDLQPWSAPGSGADATPSASVSISSNCAAGFAPSFTAGTTNPQAGAYSPFALSFTRSDSDQDLSGLSLSLPAGVSAKLAGVPLCSDAAIAAAASTSGAAQLASPSCPAASQVGTARIGSGPGTDPFFLSGDVYLTGPYKGAPYGLAVIVPAVAGPLDLGTVVVRQTLNVDPTDAHVTVTSDPFPTILAGVPLRIRRVDVVLDRSQFTVNPTSCDPAQITGSLSSALGATEPLATHFQVGGCQALGFSPSLKISLTGKGKTRSGDHPTLAAKLSEPSGQANISSAKVTLPLSLALDPKNSNRVCPYATALAVHGGAVGCNPDTIVGTASATTPLLSQPLTGNVYLVQGIRFNARGQAIRTLPTLLIPLRGQFALDLRASTATNKSNALVSTFSNVPDVPVSQFDLNINGGPKGLLVITGRKENICNSGQKSSSVLDAHSGKQTSTSSTAATPCPKHKKQTKHKKTKHKNKKKKKK
jgi:hypothetical protein